MRIVGVVDLLGGRAVHAVRGARETYQPVAMLEGAPLLAGDARALAEGYRDRLGVTDLYCADLDVIAGHPWQEDAIAQLASLGLPLWLDAGVSSVAHAEHASTLGADHIVVGLETLESFGDLEHICRQSSGAHVAFSLDLRHGEPLRRPADAAPGDAPTRLAERSAHAGVDAVIVLDLARVGTGGGLDLTLLAHVRRAVPSVMLLTGGGVRDADDLARLIDAGCDGALVATALQNGRLTAVDVATARARGQPHGPTSRRLCP